MYLEKYLNEVPMTSGWATEAAVAESVGCLSGSWDTVPEEGGVVLYDHGGKLMVDGGDECRHVLVVGATGTGKSRMVIIPSLLYSLRAQRKRSFVIFDLKGEIEEVTGRWASGHDILHINFRDPKAGDRWNPFSRANRLYFSGGEEAEHAAHKLLEDAIASIFSDGGAKHVDPFWRNSSADLFRGVCETIWSAGRRLDLRAILKLADTIPAEKTQDDQCELFRLADRSTAAKRMLNGIRRASDITRGNVLACYRGYLSTLTARNDVLDMVSGASSLSFKQLGKKPTVLYVSLPDDSTALGGLQGMLLTQLMQELNECALENGGCLPVRTELYIDELCNIKPAIPSLETALTISRSRGMRYVLTVQSYAQLVGVYETAAETIAANCATWIAFNVSKDETFREKLSRLCGCNALGEPLITPTQLSQLKYEQAVVVRERCAPYFTLLEDLSRVQAYLESGTQPERGMKEGGDRA